MMGAAITMRYAQAAEITSLPILGVIPEVQVNLGCSDGKGWDKIKKSEMFRNS